MSPSSGFDCSLFANYALDGIKAALAFTMSVTGSPCARLDSFASSTLSHPAFQWFTWPMMTDTLARPPRNEVVFHSVRSAMWSRRTKLVPAVHRDRCVQWLERFGGIVRGRGSVWPSG